MAEYLEFEILNDAENSGTVSVRPLSKRGKSDPVFTFSEDQVDEIKKAFSDDNSYRPLESNYL